jgi:MSHA biogenesis protein MshP
MVSAIFLLVVLASLGAFMVQFSTVQSTTSAQDVMGVHAYQAARAGIERAVAETAGGVCTSDDLPTLPGELAAFTVTVTCTLTVTTEGETNIRIWDITSTASTTGVLAGSLGYAERMIQVSVARAI